MLSDPPTPLLFFISTSIISCYATLPLMPFFQSSLVAIMCIAFLFVPIIYCYSTPFFSLFLCQTQYYDVVHVFVGTLKDGYIRNVPLPRVPRIQSAKLIAPSRCIPVDAYEYASGVDAYEYASGVDVYKHASNKGTPLPGYLPVASWIPTLPKLGSLLGFSQRVL